MNGFDIFRINCWLEDIEDSEYSSSISAIVCEFLMSQDNKEQLRNVIFEYVKEVLGLKINYESFIKIIDSNDNFEKESVDEDILLKLKDEVVQKFRERHDKYSIDSFLSEFCENPNYTGQEESIKDVLLKSLYININSFAVSDLKTLISESVKKEFSQDEIDSFNTFIDWDNSLKNKSIYALFSKSIEFAILTSNRGISSISNEIFVNKTYYLDTNVVIRALGVDGEQRKESIISIIESCNHDGIKFKLSRVSYDEIYQNLNNRTRDIKRKTSFDSEKILFKIIDDIPINNSFEIDYINKRKQGKVSSPNNYRLNLEKEFQIFCDKYNVEVEPIKGIKRAELAKLQRKLCDTKHEQYGRWHYSMGAALVDAKNILHVRQVRGQNDYNYKDIKSFYLTTDGTLNEIASNENTDSIAETILPSQLFIIHNSFHKKDTEEDYKDFTKFIKMRRTDFNLPGQEIFSFINQIQESTTNPDDIKSSLKAYANYRFKNRSSKFEKREQLIPLKEFADNLLEKELGKTRQQLSQLEEARVVAIGKLSSLMKISRNLSYLIEFIVLTCISILLSLLTKSINTTAIVIGAIIVFRLILLFTKDIFGIHKRIRNYVFSKFVKRQVFPKVHPNDDDYKREVEKLKQNAA